MLYKAPIVPVLPEGTLALTYDDGPGPDTLKLGRYLESQGVRATFFVVGSCLREHPGVVSRLRELGHVVGNHTDTHQKLPDIVQSTGRLREELAGVHAEIERQTGEAPRVFRAPYGAWNVQVAEALREVPQFRDYIGPIQWTVENGDWDVGQPRNQDPRNPIHTVEACRAGILRQIQERRCGTVLLHDWAADPEGDCRDRRRRNNRCLEITEWLIPQIRDYNFVTL